MTFLDVVFPTYTRITTQAPLTEQTTPPVTIDPMIFIVPIVTGLIVFAVVYAVFLIRKSKMKLQNNIVSE